MSAEQPKPRASPADRLDLSQAISAAQRAAWRRLDNSARARLLLGAQRHRDRMFGQSVLRDPGFDILLDLYVHYPADRVIAALCDSLSPTLPAAIALRYISHLQDNGLVRRTTDPSGSGVGHIGLTAATVDRLEAYLAEPLGPFPAG